MIIEHKHLNQATKKWTGDEYRLVEWGQKPVDGYFIDENGTRTVIEFLGDYFHGHPRFWGENEDRTDHHKRLFKDLFYNTERILTKVKSFGYKILYCWEYDFKKIKSIGPVINICKEFHNKLEI